MTDVQVVNQCRTRRAGIGFGIGVLLLSVLHPAPAGAATTALRFNKLVDGSGKVINDAVVVVDGDRITSVGSGASAIPANAKVVDLHRFTAIPGMIDVHTHITRYWDGAPGTTPYRQPAMQPAETVFLDKENARKTLECGVTAVRDLGANDLNDIAMRNLINRGAMVGPRMFVATHNISAAQVSGATEMMRAVRQTIANGADWVKLFASTGGTQNLTGDQTLTYDEMKAAVEVAHHLGHRVAVHSYGPDGARDAARAGVDTIEHPVTMDDETIREIVKRGIWYVPTIDHNRYYADNADLFQFPVGVWSAPTQQKVDSEAELKLQFSAFIEKNTRRALKAGVKVGMGSDALYTMAGQNTRELGALVKAGMTPAQALAAATTTGAAILGMEKSLGAIAPGYFADIVAVEGDPLADVNVTINNVRWVMKGGAVVVDKTSSPNARN
jgi:imidazolonepropionase-like amidohydrolase